jgi:hypothetical protein
LNAATILWIGFDDDWSALLERNCVGFTIGCSRFQVVRREAKFLNDITANEMFLDNSFKYWRGTTVIPGAFGINHSDGPVHAYLKAICFGAKNRRVVADKIFLFEPPFQIIPRL